MEDGDTHTKNLHRFCQVAADYEKTGRRDLGYFLDYMETMKEKGITQYALIKKHNISPAQITRLKRNESVSTHTIDIFCDILDCKVEDIMEHKKSIQE